MADIRHFALTMDPVISVATIADLITVHLRIMEIATTDRSILTMEADDIIVEPPYQTQQHRRLGCGFWQPN